MAFIPAHIIFGIGSKVRNVRRLESCAGSFQIGTLLKVVGYDEYRGFSVEDDFGNRMLECGFDFVLEENYCGPKS